jgi:hypothetical protein
MESQYITPRQNGKGTYINSDGTTITVNLSTIYTDLQDFSDIEATYGPRRIRGIEFYVGGLEDSKNLVVKEDFKIPEYNYQTYYKGSDGIIFLPIILTPKVFAAWAAAYDPQKEDRTAWLEGQVSKLDQSWKQYVAATADLQARAAKFDGQFDTLNKWVATAGGIAIATKNPYAIGAAVVVQGALVVANLFKRKADIQAVKPYIVRAEKLVSEMKEITAYHEKYKGELSGGHLTVFALLGGVIILSNK